VLSRKALLVLCALKMHIEECLEPRQQSTQPDLPSLAYSYIHTCPHTYASHVSTSSAMCQACLRWPARVDQTLCTTGSSLAPPVPALQTLISRGPCQWCQLVDCKRRSLISGAAAVSMW